MKTRGLLLALLVVLFPIRVFSTTAELRAAEPYLLIVGGLGGESYYTDLFHRWVESLAEIGMQRLGVPPEHLIRLEETPSPSARPSAAISRKENVLDAFARLERDSSPGDVVAVVLMGHGTARGDRAQFNLPGPDLSATELAAALDRLAGRTVAVVVAAPASAPFIEALSAPERIIITATANASETQHTSFGGHFLNALAQDAADTDKDGRVSLLEAFHFANREVARAFETGTLLRTEHALLDDNGDGVGSRDPTPNGGEGRLAARIHLSAPAHRPDTAAGAEALSLEIEARRLVDRIETLKREKRNLATEDYLVRLETLLVELALNRRAYRGVE